MILAPVRDKKIDTSEIKYLIVEEDSQCDIITFQVKKMYGTIDLSAYTFVLKYANSEGEGEAISLSKTTSGDVLHLSFTPKSPFTDVSGKTTIQIFGTKSPSENWQSEPAYIRVINNVDPAAIRPEEPSLMQQLLNKITSVESDLEQVRQDLDDAADIIEGADDIRQSLAEFTSTLEGLRTQITSMGTSLTNETSARQSADSNLQGQIDAIVSKTDVVDIVATYQDLLDYDTSSLGDKDVVKVLNDSTHSNSRSYYRWSTTNETWTYVGSESIGYTKSEADGRFQQKETGKGLSSIKSFSVSGNTLKLINQDGTETQFTGGAEDLGFSIVNGMLCITYQL